MQPLPGGGGDRRAGAATCPPPCPPPRPRPGSAHRPPAGPLTLSARRRCPGCGSGLAGGTPRPRWKARLSPHPRRAEGCGGPFPPRGLRSPAGSLSRRPTWWAPSCRPLKETSASGRRARPVRQGGHGPGPATLRQGQLRPAPAPQVHEAREDVPLEEKSGARSAGKAFHFYFKTTLRKNECIHLPEPILRFLHLQKRNAVRFKTCLSCAQPSGSLFPPHTPGAHWRPGASLLLSQGPCPRWGARAGRRPKARPEPRRAGPAGPFRGSLSSAFRGCTSQGFPRTSDLPSKRLCTFSLVRL